MGGKSSGNDYNEAAVAQGEANRQSNVDQTYANRPTQTTPWGTTSWTATPTVDPGTGYSTTAWDQTTALTPELQAILDAQIGIEGERTDLAGDLTSRMTDEFGNPVDWSNLSPYGEIGDPNAFRQQAEDNMYASAVSRIEPKFAEDRRALEVKLRNQGLGPEDAAWQAQFEAIDQAETDALNQAQWSATEAGRAEANQMYGQNLSSAEYANQIRQQELAELMTQRGWSLNEINALLSGTQVGMPQMPSFTSASAAQPAPIYNAAVDASNADAAGLSAGLGGVSDVAQGIASIYAI